MTDTTTNDSTGKREAVAKHELIAAPGGDHVSISEAVGIRYTDRKTGQKFEYIIPDAQPGTAATMLALFGAKTKATNEASRIRNGEGGDTVEQFEALDEVFGNITKGVWREKAEGGGGTRTDWTIYAQVLVDLLGDKAAGDVAHYQDRLGAGIDKDALTETQATYRKQVQSNDKIKAEYKVRAGKTGPAIDSLA